MELYWRGKFLRRAYAFELIFLLLDPMATLLNFIQKAEHINTLIGKRIAWLIPFLALLTFFIAALRYTFALGWVWSQEMVIYIHGALFMLGIPYTLLKEDHVRIDIFYRDMDPRRRALVDLLGSIGLLFPFCILFLIYSVPYVFNSWKNLEDSSQAGGLPFVYLFKSLLVLMPLSLLMQGLSLGTRSFLVIFGKRIKGKNTKKNKKALVVR